MNLDFANQVIAECASTNDLAKQLGDAHYPEGTWVSARVQTQGRGRMGRSWQTIEGNLFLSMVCRVEEPSLWTWVSIAAGVAIVETLNSKFAKLNARLKWPNDLMILDGGASKKLGGILCEGVSKRSGSYIVIGLGLNCVDAPQVDQPTASLSKALGQTIHADQVRSQIIQALQSALERLRKQGGDSVARDFEIWSALKPGAQIEWKNPDDPSVKAMGYVIGLGQSGQLVVEDRTGKKTELFAEDISVKATR